MHVTARLFLDCSNQNSESLIRGIQLSEGKRP